MSWGLVAVAGATLVTGAIGAKGAKDAARAQGRGADAATAESARQYDVTRNDLAPARSVGVNALGQLARNFGLGMDGIEGEFDPAAYLRDNPDVAANSFFAQNPEEHYLRHGRNEGRARPTTGGTPGVAAGAPDMSGFFTSPGYEFRRDEGTRGLERSAAARGGAFSGNALRALAEFNSGLASQEYGQYFNQLASLAGIGQTATNQTAAYGADHAANAGRNALAAGDARASGIIGQSNAIGQGVSDLAGAYGYYSANRGRTGNHMAGGGTDPYGYYRGGGVRYG